MIRQIRLITGLVLFAYVLTHLMNHTLGLVSYPAMEAGRVWFLAVWRNPVGTSLLYASLLAHFVLAFWALYERRMLSMPVPEAVQLALGLTIPALLAQHVIGTRLANAWFGTVDNYAYVLLVQFKYAPHYIFIQTAALLAAWVHGCIGLYGWFRLKPWYRSEGPLLLSAAVLLPVLAWLGYVAGGRQVLALAADKAWIRAASATTHWPNRAAGAELESLSQMVWWLLAGVVILTLLARCLRTLLEHRRGMVHITYPKGIVVSVAPGSTLLQASRLNAIPHASVCGGRGRCSTCRVRFISGFELLPRPSESECRVLERIGNPAKVRLACQTRPVSDVEILPLLPPNASASDGFRRPAYLQGEEREIAILFADLRDFTRFSEQKLPYDVVFVLNCYFAAMGEAVAAAGGHLDKFIGDGVMALFGIHGSAVDGAREGLAAAALMSRKLAELNQALASELYEPLRIGIGIHLGPAIIGEMGYGAATILTAVGDAVNTASRLEAMTKEYGAQLVVSDAVTEAAGIDLTSYPSHQLDVRGRTQEILARVIENAGELPVSESGKLAI